MQPAMANTAGATVAGRVAMLFGLAGIAITQPLLDLFGRNPEFFVAGRYSTTTILLFALLIALGPGTALSVLSVVAGWLHPRAGSAVLLGLIAMLGALFGNVLARGIGSDRLLAAAAATLIGAAAAIRLATLRPGRLLLQYLAAGNVLFLVGFVVMSPTSELLLGPPHGGDRGQVSVPELPGPVVVVILDELPLTTILTPEGAINAERFPNFAELASSSTWLRNASVQHTRTHLAVPALLTGVMPSTDDLPTYQDHPRNLLTLLGDRMPVERYELVTDLCPADICEEAPHRPLSAALEDAAVVFGHRVLPARLRAGLPDIDHSWGGFGEQLGSPAPAPRGSPESWSTSTGEADPFARWRSTPEAERRAPGQAAILTERALAVTAEPKLHFIHVQLPHFPWIITPWGTRLFDYAKRVEDPADPAYGWSSRQQYQLQSMQVGAADVAIGGLISHLKDLGAWEQSTVVVVSDHGVSVLPPDFGRVRTDANEQQLLRVPMFIKAPGQLAGEVIDRPAQSIDLLPSLIDLLDIDTDWEFDGHSLFDGSEPSIEPLVGRSFAPALEVVRRHTSEIPGLDWVGLAAVGEHAELVGQNLDELRLGAPSDLSWSPDHEDDFARLPTASGAAPQLLTGVIHTSSEDPPELIVAVNGVVAGTTGGYQVTEGGMRFSSFLGPFLRTGANEIRAFVVEDTSSGPLLREVS
ncbi:MAG: sulfatase-like hydrolase/transferase [Actinomycetota bacterium]